MYGGIMQRSVKTAYIQRSQLNAMAVHTLNMISTRLNAVWIDIQTNAIPDTVYKVFNRECTSKK